MLCGSTVRMGIYPRAGKMLKSHSQCLVWMPRDGHTSLGPCSPLGLPRYVSLVDAHAQAEHLLIRGGSSPPAECCWEVVAFPSH